MGSSSAYENELKVTELRLGLAGTEEENPHIVSTSRCLKRAITEEGPPSKSQIIGWPPIRSYRKKSLVVVIKKVEEGVSSIYVKVSMDGAPYLRKMNLNNYLNYSELLKAVEEMFNLAIIDYYYYVTYQDKDGDWMLLGDVPWEMFLNTCNRLRIIKTSSSMSHSPLPTN